MIDTPRLELVPASPFLLLAETRNPNRLGRLLDAEVPGTWPPPSVAAERNRFFRLQLDHRDDPDWFDWFVIYKETRGRRVLVGSCGFLGPPDLDGTVEMGYAILPAWQSMGVASESVASLVDWAFSDGRVQTIRARVARGNQASITVLRNAGFHPEAVDPFQPGIRRFHLVAPS